MHVVYQITICRYSDGSEIVTDSLPSSNYFAKLQKVAQF